jgi:hypothetical protein
MSSTPAPSVATVASVRKRKISQRVLDNADPLLANKKARVGDHAWTHIHEKNTNHNLNIAKSSSSLYSHHSR